MCNQLWDNDIAILHSFINLRCIMDERYVLASTLVCSEHFILQALIFIVIAMRYCGKQSTAKPSIFVQIKHHWNTNVNVTY